MNLLNRGFISIIPKREFLEWKLSVLKEELIEPESPEPTIYLIEDEFWDEDEILKKYFNKIAKQEFNAISESSESWPKMGDVEQFSKYFDSEFGTFVFDLLKTPINSDKMD